MEGSSEQSKTTCCLLDLPDVIIDPIIAGLAPVDKKRLMAVSKTVARMLALRASEASLKITQDTKFTGIQQVLDWFPASIHLEILCPDVEEENVRPDPDVPLSAWDMLMSMELTILEMEDAPTCGEEAITKATSQDESDENTQLAHELPSSAMDVFMGMVPSDHLTKLVSNCTWETITKVTIQGRKLRCLVPRFLAITCPNLTQLKVVKPSTDTKNVFTNTDVDALPLTVCSSLKKLHLDYDVGECAITQLPPAHHTIAELRRNLPNIDTLVMTTPNADLIEAFAAQLTHLEVRKYSLAVDKAFRQCSRLEHLSVTAFALPDNVASLKVLEMAYHLCSSESVGQLIQLPALNKLRLVGSAAHTWGTWYAHTPRDAWRGLSCSWQELHVHDMGHLAALGNLNLSNLKILSSGLDVDFVAAAYLNLRSLEKWRLGPDADIFLPYPSDPDSMAAVQSAADILAGVGRLHLETNSSSADTAFGRCGTITWIIPQSYDDNEVKAAKMVNIAAQHIKPGPICNLQYVLRMPSVLDAVIDWGQPYVETVCLGYIEYPLLPHVWQALQRLSRLHSVLCWDSPYYFHTEITLDERWITRLVCLAAQKYVIPANRGLHIIFGNSGARYEEAKVTQTQFIVCEAIKRDLPAGSMLSNFDFSFGEGRRSSYGEKCDATAFWVFVLEPTQ